MVLKILRGGYGFCVKYIEEEIEEQNNRKVFNLYTEDIREIYRYLRSPLRISYNDLIESIYIIRSPKIKQFIDSFIRNPISNKNILNYIYLITLDNLHKNKVKALDKLDIEIIDIETCKFYTDLKQEAEKYFITSQKKKCWELLKEYCDNDYYHIKRNLVILDSKTRYEGTKLSSYKLREVYELGVNYSAITKFIRSSNSLEGLDTLSNMEDGALYALLQNRDGRLSILQKNLIESYNRSKSDKISDKILRINRLSKEFKRVIVHRYKKGILKMYSYLFYILYK